MSSSRRSSISSRSQSVTLLDQIDEWERGNLILVKQTAARARQRANELMISNEFRRRNSVDSSLEDLNSRLKNLPIPLNTSSSDIRLNITPIDWSNILRVFIQTSGVSNSDLLRRKDLFVGTKDGFTIDDFHRCSDSQGPTMTIIQTLDNYLFGGFTSISCNFHQGVKSGVTDRTPFLFTLTNPHGISARKYSIKPSGDHAVIPNAMGPTFGQYDISIYPNSNFNSQSFIQFPTNYIDSTGKGYLTFTGSTSFTTTDIEIYRQGNI